jgi:hypothetical protein
MDRETLDAVRGLTMAVWALVHQGHYSADADLTHILGQSCPWCQAAREAAERDTVMLDPVD